MNPKSHSIKGFTLLELLVALTICVFIGIGAHAMLQSVISAQAASKAHSEQFAQLQKAMWMMTEDMEQIVPASLMTSPGNNSASFVRRGWSNPLGLPRSDILQVAYEFDGHSLKRHYWSEDDKGTTQQTQLLLADITNFSLRQASPLAVEITFSAPLYGSLRRVIEIPGL